MKSLLLLSMAMVLPLSYFRMPTGAFSSPAAVDPCKCSQSQDALPTRVSVNCHVNTACISYSVAPPQGTASPGKCFKEEVCGATAERCEHKPYSITLTVGACAGEEGTGCCGTTRPAKDGPPPVPAGIGCMKVKVNGTAWGLLCVAEGTGESTVIPVGAPPNHLCEQVDHVTTIKVECPETGDTIFELTVTFRCNNCPAIASDG